MKNELMEQGDVIIHFIDKEKKYQWIYYTKDADQAETNKFKVGKIESITSTRFFDTKEEAVTDLNKYVENHHLKKPNVLNRE